MRRGNVEDIYPLSPMQMGMMFHTLKDPDSGVYVEQIRLTLDGLDPETFHEAWTLMFERFTALRTAIVGTGRKEPVQVVRREVALPWATNDGRARSAAEQNEWIRMFLEDDRRRGFALDEPTLVRLMLVRTGERRYEFVWTLHHIVLDGWSGSLVLRDLFHVYDALRRGDAPVLPPITPFREYIGWLRRRDLAGAESYWRHTLEGFGAATTIGGDRPARIGRDVTDYAEESIALSETDTAALRAAAASRRVTLNTLLSGAWALLLGRYSGERDVLFGTVVSGRPEELPGVETMVGMFVNTLPLRVGLPDEATTDSWLRALQQQQSEQRQYEFSPLWQIQQWSDVPSGAPLFESLFVFENYRVGASPIGNDGGSNGELQVTVTHPFDRTGYPLMLLVLPTGAMRLRITYDSARFEAATIQRMLRHLQRLLHQLAQSDDAPIDALTLIDDAERDRVLTDWNRTEQTYPAGTMHGLFEDSVDAGPDAVAVIHGPDALTYRALDERANRLAHHLRELGAEPDTPVGLCVERSLDMVVGILAILKAGGGYLPLDPGYPDARLAFMLEHARAPIVITHRAVTAALSAQDATIVDLDRDADAIAAQPATRPHVDVDPAHLLYVLYTSGSTGRPKGVAMPHAPLVNLMHWQLGASRLEPGARTLQFAPCSFDVSCQEIFSTLAAGGTLCLIDDETRRDPAALLELMQEEQVARVFLPFVALQGLAETAVSTDRVPTALREVITAGEQLQVTPAVVEFFERLDDASLVNQYGPTECHVVSSYTLCGAPRTWPALPPIGRPIANTRLYLLDEHRRPVPVGIPGEVWIGGAAVARGYLHEPAQTAERFVDDPFVPGGRLYRTGDLGRYDDAGDIEFLGRTDDQVKIRGFRVELGEVESVLLEHPAVRQVAAVIREDRSRDRRLVAYVVAEDEAAPTANGDDVRAFATGRLAEYMVPTAIVRVERLPLTPSGKIDRRALLAERYAPTEQRASYVAPRHGIEEVLAAIWAEVLGITQPGVHDDFFELGGHSLMVTQLVSRVRDALGRELAIRDVFDHPTIACLAAFLGREDAPTDVPALVAAPRDGDPPLSFAQHRLWFVDQLGAAAAYNMPWAFRLEGAIDIAVLERTLDEIVRRHEALRTSFPSVGGRPVQRIHPSLRIAVRVIDVDSEDEARAIYAKEALAPFDLAKGPLLRATVVRLGDDDSLLFLSIHHIVFDGWSIGILNRELFTLYRAFAAGEPSPLPPLPIQYADFSIWQNGWLRGEIIDTQLAYWREHLAGLSPLELPADHPRPPVQTYNGSAVRFAMNPELARALRTLSQRRGVTLAMTLLAAYKTLLARWSGQADIAVGSPIANRTRSEVESLIGFFVNSLVLRTDLGGDPSFAEVLARVRRTALDAYQHQDLPFERLVDELQPQRDQSRNPLFQVVFAFQNAPRDALQLPGAQVRGFDGGTVATRFDLELHLQESASGVIGGGFCYNTDLFDHGTIERLAGRFQRLLEAIAQDADAPISQANLLPEAERSQILDTWNDTSTSFEATVCLHERFEQQVRRTPDRIAVTFENEHLTYAELNRRSNRLAHRLRDLGVEPDDLVGLSLDRGPNLVVGILGILKAGGGYLPLDLANPRDRIAFILDDTKVRVLVTESSQLEKLPEHDATVVCLDRDREAIAQEPETDPAAGAGPGHVAYVIYTSGSTGAPKGVLVEHGTVVRLFAATDAWYGFDQDDVWTLFHSSAFDFSVWELWGALLHGGRLVVVPYWVSRSPEDFLKLLDQERVTVLNQTPSAFRQLMRVEETLGGERDLALRYVIFGGEALDLQSLRPWFDRHGDERPQLVNMYGITETTVHVTYRPLSRRDLAAAPGSVIGRPIPDLQVYILDERLEPVPIGVPGELFVGGAGVARGYLNRPELTAQRFVHDPFRTEPDARLYRTGDVGRFLPNGDIEYLGRNDEQVKIRGYRIELGEIEATIGAHPWVRESVVDLRQEPDGDQRLIGYVVPDPEGAQAEQTALVEQWQTLYDSTYGHRAEEHDPTFNIIGWNSSYTGAPIPAEEMRDWVDETVERLRGSAPQRVLEIGCGTGLLLFRVAPQCASYVGCDFSQVAIDYVERHLENVDGLASKVTLRHRKADDFEGLESESFDLVVVNSVVQYFPNIDYLLEVIEGAVAHTAPGGRVYIGDVRDLRLLEAYHASVQLHQADADLDLDELRRRVRQHLVQEEELVVDPAFFLALPRHLPRIRRVHIEPKRSAARNELTKFRYEVTLEIGPAVPDADCTWLDWSARDLSLETLREHLLNEPPQTVGVRGIPDARTAADIAAAQRLLHGSGDSNAGALRNELDAACAGAGVDPADLFGLEASVPYQVAIGRPHRSERGVFDAYFTPRGQTQPAAPFPTPSIEPLPWARYANHPLQAKMTRQLAPKLRESLERMLPQYMVPSAFVMLASLPLTENGKVDRGALPEPEWYLSQRRGAYTAPRNETEVKLASIWSELLGVEEIGVDDDFFDLGGHSLLAAQVVSRTREAFGVEIEVRQIFDTPTVGQLGEALDGLTWAIDNMRDARQTVDVTGREGGEL